MSRWRAKAIQECDVRHRPDVARVVAGADAVIFCATSFGEGRTKLPEDPGRGTIATSRQRGDGIDEAVGFLGEGSYKLPVKVEEPQCRPKVFERLWDRHFHDALH